MYPHPRAFVTPLLPSASAQLRSKLRSQPASARPPLASSARDAPAHPFVHTPHSRARASFGACHPLTHSRWTVPPRLARGGEWCHSPAGTVGDRRQGASGTESTARSDFRVGAASDATDQGTQRGNSHRRSLKAKKACKSSACSGHRRKWPVMLTSTQQL
ncbi:hypothetical protein CALVIDRAFT_207405 [Calocera viscosa TUFC12733]|uniref:Uncharacterized protein n=1 Tax=Calocera viscosa (strain TUFC12733) TaxID=1330018 RepID=A0A167R8X3_CALVF|nr:hypothetical protein CALVIDRAFT_207405 [Calocera viscosa TUFC12733]